MIVVNAGYLGNVQMRSENTYIYKTSTPQNIRVNYANHVNLQAICTGRTSCLLPGLPMAAHKMESPEWHLGNWKPQVLNFGATPTCVFLKTTFWRLLIGFLWVALNHLKKKHPDPAPDPLKMREGGEGGRDSSTGCGSKDRCQNDSW